MFVAFIKGKLNEDSGSEIEIKEEKRKEKKKQRIKCEREGLVSLWHF